MECKWNKSLCNKKGLWIFNEMMQIFFVYRNQNAGLQLEIDMPGYYQYWNYAEKKGYSGNCYFLQKKKKNLCQ